MHIDAPTVPPSNSESVQDEKSPPDFGAHFYQETNRLKRVVNELLQKQNLKAHCNRLSQAIQEDVLRPLLDLLIPAKCPVSDERVERTSQLSGRGWASLQFIDRPFCARCSLPFVTDHGPEILCAGCSEDSPGFRRVRSALAYDEAARSLIVPFKHKDRTDLAPLLARLLARIAPPLLTPDSVLVPVPLHRDRLIARRYNQSALLAKELSRIVGVPFSVDGVERHRATLPQKDLSASGRYRNVAGAFRVNETGRTQFAGRDIVLIDDVFTTGSTLTACARAIMAGGAKSVDGLVLARVVKSPRQAI